MRFDLSHLLNAIAKIEIFTKRTLDRNFRFVRQACNNSNNNKKTNKHSKHTKRKRVSNSEIEYEFKIKQNKMKTTPTAYN